MIENPVMIRNRAFRTPLAAQWWRFFNYLGIRCPALRPNDGSGKWWSEVDFYLPALKVYVLTVDHNEQINLETVNRWGSSVLVLGPVPTPETAGEWCWRLGNAEEAGAPNYVSFHGVSRTGRLSIRHDVLGGDDASLAVPLLDTSITPDIEVQRALWVARTGAANSTGRRRFFGPDGVKVGSIPIDTPSPEQERLTVASPTEPDPANYQPDGRRVLLYLHYDAAGVLLYIGISDQPTRRGKTHAYSSDWTQYATRMEGRWLDSRREAEDWEVYLVRTLGPVFNFQHNDSSKVRERRKQEYLRSRASALALKTAA